MTQTIEQSADATYKARRAAIDEMMGQIQYQLQSLDAMQSQQRWNWGLTGTAEGILAYLQDASAALGSVR